MDENVTYLRHLEWNGSSKSKWLNGLSFKLKWLNQMSFKSNWRIELQIEMVGLNGLSLKSKWWTESSPNRNLQIKMVDCSKSTKWQTAQNRNGGLLLLPTLLLKPLPQLQPPLSYLLKLNILHRIQYCLCVNKGGKGAECYVGLKPIALLLMEWV